ncbi:hypothetical protein D9756_001521 [Leucocoprinus leucothites]|uniref:Adenylate kinase active site lid domain-containing protein n=1 Tax=Leucocoprinus leucothites TaxID=201217 RepID=A0A8H5G520_9AGAR|nr:hypothetical protein D9756_001521 [Leucoagaricus leucothites]
MQNTAANSLRSAARKSVTASNPRASTATSTAAPITRRHFTTSPTTNKAFFLDTLRKNHTSPTSTHKINGPIGTHVSTSPSEELEKPTRFLRLIVFGKPGAGKGTLAQRLMKKYDLVSVSTGDLLRKHIAERTDIGREAEEIVARGGLMPDEIVLKVVTNELDSLRNKNWILDGFPRTLGQGELLDAHLNKHNMPLTLVVNVDVPDDVILRRISERWVHPSSGRVYNMSYNPPKVGCLDDVTGEPLVKRPDDNPETFARRLEAFYEATSPLLSYYNAQAVHGQASRKALQHPHQVSFHRPHKLKLATLSGATSDENWPHLDELAQQFPALKERTEVLRMRHSLSDSIVASGLGAANAYRPSQTQAAQ